jgi:hypothetical protein
MLHQTNQLPSLGYFHKILCECLCIWNSDNENINFNVSATESERRTALNQAFDLIKREGEKYGSFDELVTVTSQLAQKDAVKEKKLRTIQTYVYQIAKTDFGSINEFLELSEYIEVLLAESYEDWGVSELAIRLYRSTIAYYREFVREFTCNLQNQQHSYLSFMRSLPRLIESLTSNMVESDLWPRKICNDLWPLKRFAEQASQACGVSLHKLHQYHQFQQDESLNEQAWTRDFTSQQVNTRSKQVVDRMLKHSRMKWETFFPILQPLTFHLETDEHKKSFYYHAFAAMLAHNINTHIAHFSVSALSGLDIASPLDVEQSNELPSSDLLDKCINYSPADHQACISEAAKHYHSMLDWVRTLPGFVKLNFEVPSALNLTYKKEHRQFNDTAWSQSLVESPNWLNEWARAREAIKAADPMLALLHFTNSFEQARYAAGPLFIPFYIQLCAFCKSQYKLYSNRGESALFERFYAQLGDNASKFAALLGYTPMYIRDPRTLLPSSSLPIKTRLIVDETNILARMWII